MILPLCDICGGNIAPKSNRVSRQLYCSLDCAKKAKAARRTHQHVGFCPVCGAPFRGRKDKQYCGLSCKNAAWKAAHPSMAA